MQNRVTTNFLTADSLTTEQKLKLARMQKIVRNKIRKQYHYTIFKEKPRIFTYCDHAIDRIINIVDELSRQQVVVSNEIHHWTVLPNFRSILKQQH